MGFSEGTVMKQCWWGSNFAALTGLAAGLLLTGGVGRVNAADDVKASAQTSPQSAVAAATAEPAQATILVPQEQVTYETVYSYETIQVPVTTTKRSTGPSTAPRRFP